MDTSRAVILFSVVFLALVASTQAIIKDRGDCPGSGYDRHGYWFVDEKDGSRRCVLKCNGGYQPSSCNVLRLDGDDWNHDAPHCEKEPLVSGKTLLVGGAAVGAVAAAPVALGAAGFTAAGVAAGSVAASIQTSTTAAGSLFALYQSAGVLGIGASANAAIASVASATTYAASSVSSMLTNCENE